MAQHVSTMITIAILLCLGLLVKQISGRGKKPVPWRTLFDYNYSYNVLFARRWYGMK